MNYIKFFFFILFINTAWSQDLDYIPHADKIVAMGDLHGDIYAFKRALRLGELIDENDDWIGGSTVLVQVGDQTDRGDFELEIFDLIERLTAQAEKVGGKVLALLGNHEIMNAELDFRYVTPMGFTNFSKFSSPISLRLTKILPKISSGEKGRSIAFFPGGQMSAILAKHNVAVIVGDTIIK